MTTRIRNFDTALQAAFTSNQVRALAQAFGINMTAVKTTANTLTTTTIANDPELFVELYGAGTHQFEYWLNLTTTAAGGLKLQLAADQGLTVTGIDASVEFMLDATLSGVKTIAALASPVNGGTTNAWTQCRIQGTVIVQNGGVLALGVAQQAASGSTIIKADSYLITRQLPGGTFGLS